MPILFATGKYWSPMRCADLWFIGFAISLPPHSFCYRGHFPVDCAIDYDVSGYRARRCSTMHFKGFRSK